MNELKTWKMEVDYNDSMGFVNSFEFEFATDADVTKQDAVGIGLARGADLV